MEETRIGAAVAALLSRTGFDAKVEALEAVDAGGNNRAFSVRSDGARYLAKFYFRDAADRRDRLGAEFAFLTYAWESGLRCVPRPIACDADENLGLYEFVDGRKLAAPELTADHVDQAAVFFRSLNANRKDRASTLPEASEACFSIEQHVALVDRRFERLQALPVASQLDRDALEFISDVEASWRQDRDDIVRQLPQSQFGRVLAHEDRCVSPSDFGFHNALLRDSGEICFIDFEYAGWDDPAKAIGDFFCQPAIPVPASRFDHFVERALDYSPRGHELAQRARRLLPVFQTKWCCILLNEFLPEAARRRHFANPSVDPEQRKRTQLEKAKRFFHAHSTETWLT